MTATNNQREQTQKEINPFIYHRIRQVVIAVAFTLSGLCAYQAWIWASQQYGNLCPPYDISRIENIIEITIPINHDKLWSYCIYGKGYAGWVTFETSPDELESLRTNSFVKTFSANRENRPELSFPNETINSKLNQVKNFLYGAFLSNDLNQRILIDTSDEIKYIVYIQVENLKS